MPVLSNPRHERFAQGIAKGKSQHEAYKYAGFAGTEDSANACKLAQKPNVQARIRELQDKQAKRIGITVDDLLEELQLFANIARSIKQPAAGVGAVLAKAKLLGLITDRVEAGVTVRKPSREATTKKTMTMDEWAEKYAPRSERPPDTTLQ